MCWQAKVAPISLLAGVHAGIEEATLSTKANIIVYTKPGCHLCHEAVDEIRKAKCEDLYDLQEVNIESDPDLLARYRYDIPVILIDGVEALRHRLTSADFRARLGHG